MDPSGGSTVFMKLAPKSGTALVELECHGEDCALNEFAIPVEGTVAGQSPNATGGEKEVQELTLGSSQQATGGGALTLGEGTGGPQRHRRNLLGRRWSVRSEGIVVT